MHVEVSVALNFLISYLYNKLPRRRVDLFGEELEKGLKRKFDGHWYPDKPFKGSGFRCVRCNGENVDPVMVKAAENSGLDLQEVKNYIPEELTLWIDPSEVSYRISEKSPIKILYSDRHEDEAADTIDREVQAANRTFNPEAISFQPIDSLSSSLSNLSLSPSSPVPPGTWSNSTSPSSSLFSSDALSGSGSHLAQAICPQPLTATSPSQPVPPSFLSKASVNRPQFTAATFAQTKFGSTKLKSQAKRPTRLSPTELGNYFRQQQRVSLSTAPPQRPRSLSPRDPRLEFFLDQQQRLYNRGQLSPQGQHPGFGHSHHHQHHHQQLSFPPSPQGSPSCGFPFGGGELNHSSSPHLSPGSVLPPFADILPGPNTALSSPANSLSPDGHKTFLDGLPLGGMGSMANLGSMGYPGHLQHLLVAN
ncbi:protein Tob1-like [Pomacea canaliculata]|nr:protein Tob1-like [Pomacea canaliculata]XP_025105139.1 protein Tob1-like [Pomacea canaliculata]XP_025105146.1 protein Tob1-like [Pomacea canaliculata]XP_025105154.1 protein Tob1-like [Pomacea canaliculata]